MNIIYYSPFIGSGRRKLGGFKASSDLISYFNSHHSSRFFHFTSFTSFLRLLIFSWPKSYSVVLDGALSFPVLFLPLYFLFADKIFILPRGFLPSLLIGVRESPNKLFFSVVKLLYFYYLAFLRVVLPFSFVFSSRLEKRRYINLRCGNNSDFVLYDLFRFEPERPILLSSQPYSPEKLSLLYLGGAAWVKNLPFVYELITLLLSNSNLYIDLHVVSPPDLSDFNFPESSKSRIIVNRYDYISHVKAQSLINICDFVLVPSFAESFSYVVAESVNLHTRVICSTSTPWLFLNKTNYSACLPLDPHVWCRSIIGAFVVTANDHYYRYALRVLKSRHCHDTYVASCSSIFS